MTRQNPLLTGQGRLLPLKHDRCKHSVFFAPYELFADTPNLPPGAQNLLTEQPLNNTFQQLLFVFFFLFFLLRVTLFNRSLFAK